MHFSPFILYVRKRQYSQIYIHFYALCLVNYQIICLIIQLKSDNLYIRIETIRCSILLYRLFLTGLYSKEELLYAYENGLALVWRGQ